MSSLPPDTLESRVTDRLTPHGSDGLRASLAGVVDLEALQEHRYEEVLESVDARLSSARYSLVSMLVAGIYFGLAVGYWLLSLASWLHVARWAVPVVLVTTYAVYSAYQTVREIHDLAEARALLSVLDRHRSPDAA